jgi:hypothetical protein
MKKNLSIFFFILLSSSYAQTDSLAVGNVEINVIDSYITPEIPHKLVVSFFTSDSAISKIILLGIGEFQVSEKLRDNHKIEIDLSKNEGIISPLKYKIIVRDSANEESQSQLYEVEIPKDMIINSDRNLGILQVCCFGGIIFGIPSPTYLRMDGENYFSLAKEIPLFSFYSSGYNYPWGYLSAEYAHIFKAARKNFLRAGYKQIIQTGVIEYISPGINYFTDFKGYNGISTELSIGLFQIQNVFTFYTRYRYNFQTNGSGKDFHEISIGLYSNFFSLNF